MRIGFIGAGNMAQAMIRSMVQGGYSAGTLFVYDVDTEKVQTLHAELGTGVAGTYEQVVDACDAIVIAVKPHVVPTVMEELGKLSAQKLLISIAAGWTVEALAAIAPQGARCVRVMPNTPAMVGEGMMAISLAHQLTAEEAQEVERALACCGRVAWVEDRLMDAVTAVSGSGPAYAFAFIDAMADGGVREGLPRAQAVQLAAQTVLGAARMVLETGTHPAALKSNVCSPGGTTIEAVYALEEHLFYSAVMSAVAAAAAKSRELGK